ncbi:uncharacterized protein LODBEIA_P24150 [Lodderomyces beijingensis]|uniref:Thiamine phosphate synthase/TenI domain-containing protein n=1 Tax=Lodderomyces beijingensis TaxID=1775926 RepID=A0ABP0ZMS5_9ASCO
MSRNEGSSLVAQDDDSNFKNYKVYLVTDSTMIPPVKTFLGQVEDAVNNGATIIQLREKTLSTRDFIKRAEEVHRLTKPRGIPLIINDRVDVALAVDAEGVHVGQDDMPAKLVRRMIGPTKILGVTCSTPEEAQQVVDEDVADYVGLGTVYATNTKKDVTSPDGIGPSGIKEMLQVLAQQSGKRKKNIQAVAIGGLNQSNASFVYNACRIPQYSISGLAVVSCIMASQDAAQATRDLVQQLQITPLGGRLEEIDKNRQDSCSTLESKLSQLSNSHPLVHHITNNVVKNFSANVTLAIGASPIMSELPQEFDEFASKIPNLGLVLNVGTPNQQLMNVFSSAIKAYNKHQKPIVFDPVACGASGARLDATAKLLNTGFMTVIKGNVGEVMSVWKLTQGYKAKLMVSEQNSDEELMRGVDSVAELSEDQIYAMATDICFEFCPVLVVTGAVNYIVSSDGRTAKVPGGSALMSMVTGTGCSLGSVIAAFVASRADGLQAEHEQDDASTSDKNKHFDIFACVVGAVSLYNTAGKRAAADHKEPGSFMTAFIDELYKLTHSSKSN